MPYYFWKSKENKRKKRKQIIFKKQRFSVRVLLTFYLIFFANFSLVLLIKKTCTAYPKCWKTNYSLIFEIINTIIYSTFSTVLCVHGTGLKVFLKLINVNLVMKLKKGVLLILEGKMLLRYQTGSSSANGNCQQWVFSNLEGFFMISGVSGFSYFAIKHIRKHGNHGKF